MKLLSLLALIPILFSAAPSFAHEIWQETSDGSRIKITHTHDRHVDSPYNYRRSRRVYIDTGNVIIDQRRPLYYHGEPWRQDDHTQINYCLTFDSGKLCNRHWINH